MVLSIDQIRLQNGVVQSVPEVLKRLCFLRAAIVAHRLRQTGYQREANGRKSCILMCGAMSVQSPALVVMEKRTSEIKLSITLSSAVALILPISPVNFSFRSAGVWDILPNMYTIISILQ